MLKGVLVVTQVMDERDPVLGFFVKWVRVLAFLHQPLHVVCWRSDPALAIPGVTIHVLSRGASWRTLQLIRLSWRVRKEVAGVFVHMIPPVAVALGWWWRLLGWRIVLWYTHGSVSWSLRVAEWFVHCILTASEESCRLRTLKKVVVGHGIDLDIFYPNTDLEREPTVLTVGRITPRKDIKMFVHVCAEVVGRWPGLLRRGIVVGLPRTEGDQRYAEEVRKQSVEAGVEDILEWRGALSLPQVAEEYRRAGVFLSTSKTGSLDKVVLEALACGARVVALDPVYQSVPGVKVFSVEDQALLEYLAHCLSAPTDNVEARTWLLDHADLTSFIQRVSVYLVPGSPIAKSGNM